MTSPSQTVLQSARVPGSELSKRVFYESITGFKAQDAACSLYGCTIRQTAQGPYVLDHVRRIGYPLASLPALAKRGSAGMADLVEVGEDPTAHPSVVAADEALQAKAAALTEQLEVERQVHAVQIQAKDDAVQELQRTVQLRKSEVQALQRKLTLMHETMKVQAKRADQMEELLRQEKERRTTANAGPVAAISDLLPSRKVSAVEPVRSADDGPKRSRHESEKRSRSKQEGEQQPNRRFISYGDARIGVVDDDDDESSSSTSSSYSSSYSSYSSSRSSRSRSRSGSRTRRPRERSPQRQARRVEAEAREEPDAGARGTRESYRSDATRRTREGPATDPVVDKSTSGGGGQPVADPTAAAPVTVSGTAGINTVADFITATANGDPSEALPRAARVSPNAEPDKHGDRGSSDAPSSEDTVSVGLRHDQPSRRSTVEAALRSKASLPAHLLRGPDRNAVLYCHLCHTFLAPHPVNLRQHILSTGHQRVCAQIDEYVASQQLAPLPDLKAVSSEGATVVTAEDALWYRKWALTRMHDRLKGSHPCNRSQFGKVTVPLPAYMEPRSVANETAQAEERKAGNSFFDEAFDIVHPVCAFCDAAVSVQSYKMHEATPMHRERAAAERAKGADKDRSS